MEPSLLALWALAFTLGILHALDADHILAVSVMGNVQPSKHTTFIFCRNWAIGHGFTLMLVSFAVLLFGFAIPTQLSQHAEFAVASLIIILAAVLLVNIWKADSVSTAQRQTAPRKSAVAVGMLHGLAGSAPLLTVIPLSQLHSTWSALIYLVVFSVGVLVAMFCFSGVLNGVYGFFSQRNITQLKILRVFIALGAFILGIYMLAATG